MRTQWRHDDDGLMLRSGSKRKQRGILWAAVSWIGQRRRVPHVDKKKVVALVEHRRMLDVGIYWIKNSAALGVEVQTSQNK